MEEKNTSEFAPLIGCDEVSAEVARISAARQPLGNIKEIGGESVIAAQARDDRRRRLLLSESSRFKI